MTQDRATAARILLEIGALNVSVAEPYTFTSGWRSPTYVDCRRIIYYPHARKAITNMAVQLVQQSIGYEQIQAVAGGETAGIPYAAWMADALHVPMCYVRKKPKGFGKNNQIEGNTPEGLHTLLVEDLTTDGGSKISFVNALRSAGAVVNHTLVVFFYGVFPGAQEDLEHMGVTLHSLCDWHDVMKVARQHNSLTTQQIDTVEKFLENPMTWSAQHGGVATLEEAKLYKNAREMN